MDQSERVGTDSVVDLQVSIAEGDVAKFSDLSQVDITVVTWVCLWTNTDCFTITRNRLTPASCANSTGSLTTRVGQKVLSLTYVQKR